MQAVGRNADLGSQAVFEAVGETRGQVHVDRTGIDFMLEAISRMQVFGHDGFGVFRAVAGNMVYGLIRLFKTREARYRGREFFNQAFSVANRPLGRKAAGRSEASHS